jgi:2-furoyl-CoA dehydrogenase FAD binding subunit
MKPAGFDYVCAETLDEALKVLGQYGEEVRILAGGQSLMPMLNIRLAQPAVLLDISRCQELDYVRTEGNELVVGAAATQAKLEQWPELSQYAPLLYQVLPFISHFQIRNHGTVCGSIAHADPSAELPLCLVALKGSVVLRSASSQRVVEADAFFQGMLTTALQPGEIIQEVRFPLARPGIQYAFDEVSMRHGDFALVAIAAIVDSAHVELTVGGVADRPRTARWSRLAGEELELAINDFAWSLNAQSDTHASAHYRRHLVRQLGRTLIEGAMA